MDMFLNSQEISLQEMLDRDMKTEIDDVFGHSDLSLSLSELPPLDLDESFGADMPMWFTSNGVLATGNSNSSNSNFNLDFSEGAAKMVDPTSVMPCLSVQTSNNNNNDNSAYVIMSSPSMSPDIKDEPYSPSAGEDDVNIDSDQYEVPRFAGLNAPQQRPQQQQQQPQQQQQQQQQAQPQTTTIARNAIRISTTDSPTSFANTFRNGVFKNVPIVTGKFPLVHQIHGDSKTVQTYQIRDVRTLNIQATTTTASQKKLTKQFVDLDYDEKPYPKPAYSYSCLIAMALKNSATGSLPVSEIYNFMCEHFPYFKTAPNGWKNSVRHNLSLNKCFEKIEKPAGNGSQRKGCLWAMNPQKIAKMDEEVQKWSKKDPLAIKKAMINPEHLEMLEKGDLKRDFLTQTSTGSSGGSPSDASSDDEGVMTPLTHRPRGYTDAYALDSDDSSGGEELDVEIGDGILYEELDADDEKLNLGVTLTSAVPQGLLTLASGTSRLVQQQQTVFTNKRPKVTTGSGIHGNYVYQPVMSGWGSGPLKRKTPLLLRTSGNTMGSSLIKVDDSV